MGQTPMHQFGAYQAKKPASLYKGMGSFHYREETQTRAQKHL